MFCGNIAKLLGLASPMLSSSSSPECGKRLRAERERLCLSLRDVQRMSRGIAEQRKDSEYYIAHASLADIENGRLIPNIYKLYSLSVIYGRQYETLVTLFDIPVEEAEKDHKALVFPRTYLLGPPSELNESGLSALALREKFRSEPTNLVSKIFDNWKDVPAALLQQMDRRDSLCGYIGMEDFTLYPIIRPGSFVQIDSRHKTVPPVSWRNDFDRPIYFVELRDRYMCSWCELHAGQLILVPTAQSHRLARHVRYPGDATIVGRVTAVTMRIADMGGRAPKGSSPA
jgi:transcriptional regulator with XRE-family HTH domain